MNRILMMRTLIPSIRANFSTTTRRSGLFKSTKEVNADQVKLQALPEDVHVKTGMDKATYMAAMFAVMTGFFVTLNRSQHLAIKK